MKIDDETIAKIAIGTGVIATAAILGTVITRSVTPSEPPPIQTVEAAVVDYLPHKTPSILHTKGNLVVVTEDGTRFKIPAPHGLDHEENEALVGNDVVLEIRQISQGVYSYKVVDTQ